MRERGGRRHGARSACNVRTNMLSRALQPQFYLVLGWKPNQPVRQVVDHAVVPILSVYHTHQASMTVGEGVLHGRLCVLLLGHERHGEAEEAAQHNRTTISQVSSETNSNQYKPAATVWSGWSCGSIGLQPNW